MIASFPHDRRAFTQGLVWDGHHLLESTGGYGSSSLRRVELETGAVLQQVDLPRDVFGEGLAGVGDRLVQLTWRAGLAAVWDAATFRSVDELAYAGEGWGLCFDGRELVMSDGSSELVFREPSSLAESRRIQVTLDGHPVKRLNELECVDGQVWANVWMTEELLRIDPASGRVTATVDARGLLEPSERRGTDVLNGIAYRPETGTFLITGKLWPRIFEVVFEPEEPRVDSPENPKHRNVEAES